MSRDQTDKQEQTRIYWEIGRGCRTAHHKIDFFDSSKKGVFTVSNESTLSVNENIPKDLNDGFYFYTNMKEVKKTKLEKLRI